MSIRYSGGVTVARLKHLFEQPAVIASDTWDAQDMGGSVALLSNANQTAQSNSPAGWEQVRGTMVYTLENLPANGQVYWQYILTQDSASDGFFGASAPSSPNTTYCGDVSGFGQGFDGNIHTAWGGRIVRTGGYWPNTSGGGQTVLGFLFDAVNGNVEFTVNGAPNGSVVGMTVPAEGFKLAASFRQPSSSGLITMATTAAQMVGSAPFGYRPVAGGTAPAPIASNSYGAHTYWRLLFRNEPNGGWGVGQLRMFDANGASLCFGGTPYSQGDYDSNNFGSRNVYDTSLDTFWCGTNAPAAIGYQFASPVNVASMVITNRDGADGYGAQFPSDWQAQYSDDGVNWTSGASGVFSGVGSGQAAVIMI